jgi:hypothetical protein
MLKRAPWDGTVSHSLHSASMKKKPPPDKRGKGGSTPSPSPQREMSGVAPIDAGAFSRRAGEIIAKAVAQSDEKPKPRRK